VCESTRICYAVPKAPLACECDTIVTQFGHVPALREAIQQRDELQRELAAVDAAKTNFREIARVGTAHRAAVAAVLQQPLAEEDHLTLADRHAALVQKLTATYEELADAEDYDAVTVLGDKLNELQALDVSALPSSDSCHVAVPSIARAHASRSGNVTSGVLVECDALVTQFTNAPRTREAILHRNELQDTLTALRAAKSDFAAVGQVGKALKVANAHLAQLPLSEEDYLTLADRHAALVQPPAPPAPTTTAEEREEDGSNDPVYVPPAPGASQEGTVPADCTANTAAAEEGEEEWANDPVYVPPATDETTLA
jgi:hypothetical protein